MNASPPALATAERVIRQLRHDPRTIGLMIVVPSVLITLLKYVFNGSPAVFDHFAPMLLALFPFSVMFVITSVAMVRERTGGTLERLMATTISKIDILTGYAAAFAIASLIQVTLVMTVGLGPLGLSIRGAVPLVALFAILDALLGMSLGLFTSAFARTEFQAVQALPAFVFPQLLVCGIFAPRGSMAQPLQWLADILPLTYAVDGVTHAAASTGWSGVILGDLAIVAACIPVSLALGALTLPRRTP